MKSPSYLTRRGECFWFQYRIPFGLAGPLGKSPVRIALPTRDRREARLFARSLATMTEARFRMQNTNAGNAANDRESLTNDLRERVSLLEDSLSVSRDISDQLREKQRRQPHDETLATFLHLFKLENENDKNLRELATLLYGPLAPAKRPDTKAAEMAGTAEFKSTLDKLAAAVASMNFTIETNTQKIDALKKSAPPLSEARAAFLQLKRNSLNPKSKEPLYFRHRLLFLEYFLAVERDKIDPHVEEISPDDLTAFFALLPLHSPLPRKHTRPQPKNCARMRQTQQCTTEGTTVPMSRRIAPQLTSMSTSTRLFSIGPPVVTAFPIHLWSTPLRSRSLKISLISACHYGQKS